MSFNQLQKKLLIAAGETASIGSHTSKEWQSITFSGERHQINFVFEDVARGVVFANQVKDGKVDVNLPSQLISEMYVTEEVPFDNKFAVTIEVLTLNK